MRTGFLVAALTAASLATTPAQAGWKRGEGLTYWSTDVRREGPYAEVYNIEVYGGPLVTRRVTRIDCTLGVGQSAYIDVERPIRTPEKDTVRPERWGKAPPAAFSGDPWDTASLSGFACATPARRGPGEFPTIVEAIKDGMKRAGHGDVEADYRIDSPAGIPIPRYRERTNTPPTQTLAGPLDLVWRNGDRAVFAALASATHDGDKVVGQAFWLVRVGTAAKSYMLREFEVECAAGRLAHITRAAWPRYEDLGDSRLPGAPTPVATPAGGPEAALVKAACRTAAPLSGVASIDEMVAFEAPPAQP